MKLPGFDVLLRACAAAAGGALALGAAAQMPPDQIQASLERAVRTPTEVIWLRDEILADLWRNDARLSGGAICAKAGDARLGCTIGERPAWRYVFGGASFANPRFLARTSGVYIIAPQAQRAGLVRAPSGEILLAAGMSLQLIDAAYPGIQIELNAPADRPLPLGNLARADGGKLFGLLARQSGMVSASAAAVLDGGRVAFKSASDVQFAAARATEEVAAVAPVAAPPIVAPPVVAPTIAVPMPLKLAEEVRPAVAEAPVVALASAPVPASVPAPTVAVAAPEPAPVQPLVVAAAEVPSRVIEPAPVIAAVIVPPTPAPAQPIEPPSVVAAPAVVGAEAAPIPVVVAAVAPAALSAFEVKPVVAEAPATDIARLRAEVEAEIERDRVRLASAQQQACGGILKPGQGCTIGTPRRFTFSG